jgi:phenylalanyl-tRNA synthetase alpha chain
LRVKYSGRKGIFASLYERLPKMGKEEKPRMGMLINKIRQDFEEELKVKSTNILNSNKKDDFFDVSLPGRKISKGKYHPITKTMMEIRDVFSRLNFQIMDGPEIETDYYNFEALNTPEYHPARDMHSTFYIDKGILLRTHTSPIQIRTMESKEPPIRTVAFGKCYRSDAIDASHSPMFHQVEGLMVDRNINFSHLKGVLNVFFSSYFEKKVNIRLTPSYFPFTEPSAEFAVSCVKCNGKGCKICKGSGWLELGGCGMVDPNVFKYVKYDSKKWHGFAFGMGIERLTLTKYGIDDIRNFYENDLRFLKQL